MKCKFLFLLSFILITSCSQQRTFRLYPIHIGNIGITTNRDASWFSCENDSDCAVVDDMHCALASVNVLHISDFQRYAKNVMDEEYSARCEVAQRANAESYLPICDAGKCSARLKSDGISFDYEQRDNPATREDFLILQRISRNPLLGEREFRAIGEEFATAAGINADRVDGVHAVKYTSKKNKQTSQQTHRSISLRIMKATSKTSLLNR